MELKNKLLSQGAALVTILLPINPYDVGADSRHASVNDSLEFVLSPGRLAWGIFKPALAFTSRGAVPFKMLPSHCFLIMRKTQVIRQLLTCFAD